MKCKYCNKEFRRNRFWQKFCDSNCRQRQWDKDNPRIRKGKVKCEKSKDKSNTKNGNMETV